MTSKAAAFIIIIEEIFGGKTMTAYALWILAIWNLIVFLIFGIDKYKAEHNGWRIRERTLILCAVFMGATGALLGMRTFRHKTQKPVFKILIPVALVINVAVLIFFERI